MSRIALSSAQFATMRRTLQAREDSIIEQVLQQPDYPPLPPCPECGGETEQMDTMAETSKFGIDEDAWLINVKPCGHRFRVVVNPDEQP